MSYYLTESRGGYMESISRCCRQAYVYPLDTRKLLYAGGAVVGIILIAAVWSGFSSSDSSAYVQPFKGSKVLHDTPLVVGSNYFPINLRNLAQNNISKVSFDHNLSKDPVFGDANCKSCQTDIPRLQSGLVGSQIWSLRVPCSAEYKDAVALTLEQVDAMSRLLASYSNNVTVVRSSNDITDAFRKDQLGSLLAVTSGHSFDGRMAVLRTLYGLGVRVMAITSDCSTAWALSYTTDDSKTGNDSGLSEFGEAVVREMNRIGMLIDLSEASHKTQLDVLNVSKAPVVFTRAAAFDITNNSRNIKTDVLQKLKEKGGLVMVTFAGQYLNNNASNVSTSDVTKHLTYIKNITGADKVGIGSEFDAEKGIYPASLNNVSSFPSLFDQLGDEKWTEDDLKKLAGQNFLRVLQEVEKVAKESSSLPADESFRLQNNASCYTDYDTRLNKTIPPPQTTQATPTAPTPLSTPSTPPAPAPASKPAPATTPATATPASATTPSKPTAPTPASISTPNSTVTTAPK